MAFYRATGQAHKPAPPVNTGKNTAMNKSGPGQVRQTRYIDLQSLQALCLLKDLGIRF